ncbi:SDR family oxidoreductase [Lewinella sp. LCG006]|uniref:SDR family oxidoreductase n=1 Tax=Lewinella sp. LCG006 TaxID=3231911 RepID=UPI0034600F26
MPTLLLLGSNSDIGKACAYRFAAEGFDLLLATRSVDEEQQFLAADLRIRFNIQVSTLLFDAENLAEHSSFYEQLSNKPDVVLTAIGYLGDPKKARTDQAEVSRIVKANYTGLITILDIVAADMMQKKAGTIIGISSVAGERGRASNYHYGSAKAGFTAYLSGLRQYLRPMGVKVITIIPGFVHTKMIGDLPTPGFLTATPALVANAIYQAYKKQKSEVYSMSIWRLIMFIIRHIPEVIFQRLSL